MARSRSRSLSLLASRASGKSQGKNKVLLHSPGESAAWLPGRVGWSAWSWLRHRREATRSHGSIRQQPSSHWSRPQAGKHAWIVLSGEWGLAATEGSASSPPPPLLFLHLLLLPLCLLSSSCRLLLFSLNIFFVSPLVLYLPHSFPLLLHFFIPLLLFLFSSASSSPPPLLILSSPLPQPLLCFFSPILYLTLLHSLFSLFLSCFIFSSPHLLLLPAPPPSIT